MKKFIFEKQFLNHIGQKNILEVFFFACNNKCKVNIIVFSAGKTCLH